jgi:hypothetical protein
MHQTKVPRIPGRDFAGTIDVGTEGYPAGMEVRGRQVAIASGKDPKVTFNLVDF